MRSVGPDRLDISSELKRELQKYAAPTQAAGGGVRRTMINKPLFPKKANVANGGSFRKPFNQGKPPIEVGGSSFTNLTGMGGRSFTQRAASDEKGLGRSPTPPSSSPLSPHSFPSGMRSQRASISALMRAGIGGGSGSMSGRRPTLSASIMSGSVGIVGAANLTNTRPRSASSGASAGASTEAIAAAVAATASAVAARMTRVSRFDLVLEDDLHRLLDAYCAVDEGLEGSLTADEINEMCSLACVRYDPGMVTKSLELYRHHASLHYSGVGPSSDFAGPPDGCGSNNKEAVVNSSFSVRSPRAEGNRGGMLGTSTTAGERNVGEEERVPFFELFCTLFPSTSSRAVGNAIRAKMAPSFVTVLMPSQRNASPAIPAAPQVPQPPAGSSPRLIRADLIASLDDDDREHTKGPKRGIMTTRNSPDRRQFNLSKQTKAKNANEAPIAPEPPSWIQWLVKECREASSPSETRIVEALALAVKKRYTCNVNTKDVGRGLGGEESVPALVAGETLSSSSTSPQSTEFNKNGRTLNVSEEESYLRGIIAEHLSSMEDVGRKSGDSPPTLDSLIDRRAAWYDPLDPFDIPSVHINALWRVMCLAENKRALCTSLIALEEERDTEYVAELMTRLLLRKKEKDNNREGGDASKKEQFLPLSAPVRLVSESSTTTTVRIQKVANITGRVVSSSFSSVTACSPPRASRARGPTAEPPLRRSVSNLTDNAKDTVTPTRQTKSSPPTSTANLGDKADDGGDDSVSPSPLQSVARRCYVGLSSRSPDSPPSTRGHQRNPRDAQSSPILRAHTEVTAADDGTGRASKPREQESVAVGGLSRSRPSRPLTYYLPTLATLPSITRCEDPSVNMIFASSLAPQQDSLLMSPSSSTRSGHPPFWVAEALADERRKRDNFSMDADRLLLSPQQCSGETLLSLLVPPPARIANPYAAPRTGPGRIPEATLVEQATRVSVEMYVRLREDRTAFRRYRLKDILKHCKIPDVVIAHLMSIREPTFVCLRTLVLNWETLMPAIESAVRTAVANPIMCRVSAVRRSPPNCLEDTKDDRRQPHSKRMGLVSSHSRSAEKTSKNCRNDGRTPDGNSIMRRIPTAAPNTLLVTRTSANKHSHDPITECGTAATTMATLMSTKRANSPNDSFSERQSSATPSSSLSHCQGDDDATIKRYGSSSQLFPRRLFSDSSPLVSVPPAAMMPFSLVSPPSTYVTSAEVLESLVTGRLYAIVSICRRFGAMAVMRQLWDETLTDAPWPGHNSLALQAQQPVDRAEGVPPRPPISVANLVLSARQITEMFAAADQAEGTNVAGYFALSTPSSGYLAALSRCRPPLPPCAFTASEVAAVSGVLNASEKKFPAFGTVGGEHADSATSLKKGEPTDEMKKKRLFLPYPTSPTNHGDEICATHQTSRSAAAAQVSSGSSSISDALGDTINDVDGDGDCESFDSFHLLAEKKEEDFHGGDHSSFFLTATGALLRNNKITDKIQTAVGDDDLYTLSSEPDERNAPPLISGSGSSLPSHPARASPPAVTARALLPNNHNNKIPLAPSSRALYPFTSTHIQRTEEQQQEHTKGEEHFPKGGESQRAIVNKGGGQGLVVRRFHPLSPRHSFTRAERTQRRVIEVVSALTTPNSIPHSEYLAAYGRTTHYTVVGGGGRDATVVRPKDTDNDKGGANAREIGCDTDGEDNQTFEDDKEFLSSTQTSSKGHAIAPPSRTRRVTSPEINEYQFPHYYFPNQTKRRHTAPTSPEGGALASERSRLVIRSLMPASRPPPFASESLRPRSASIPTTDFKQTKRSNEGEKARRRTSATDYFSVSQWSHRRGSSARQSLSSGLVGEGVPQQGVRRKSSAALASAVMKHVVVNASDAERQYEDYLRGQRRSGGRSSVDAPRYATARARFDCLEDPFPQPAMCSSSEGDYEEAKE